MTDIQHVQTGRVLLVRETIAVPHLPEFQGRAFLTPPHEEWRTTLVQPLRPRS